jgi:S-formylglutathione hydrolase FrmB
MTVCNDNRYCSVSAFAPICNPVESPWGQKALPRYLGNDKEKHKEYDATELMVSETVQAVTAIVVHATMLIRSSVDVFLSITQYKHMHQSVV